tara:strand:+ start:1693 stop:1854 length:162 start_codon:yes stop_codon:yes gene_type:complete
MSEFNFAPDRWEFWRELPDPDDAQYDCLDEHDDDESEEGNIETEQQGWEQSQR